MLMVGRLEGCLTYFLFHHSPKERRVTMDACPAVVSLKLEHRTLLTYYFVLLLVYV